jgi:hypothetical protein
VNILDVLAGGTDRKQLLVSSMEGRAGGTEKLPPRFELTTAARLALLAELTLQKAELRGK